MARMRMDDMRYEERWHAEPHSSPYHHVGPCDEACRRGRTSHAHRTPGTPLGSGVVSGPPETVRAGGASDPAPSHLYRGPEGRRERREFVSNYERQFRSRGEPPAEARAHAERVYGATVGKVKRERAGKERS